jgi:hypothetical protein
MSSKLEQNSVGFFMLEEHIMISDDNITRQRKFVFRSQCGPYQHHQTHNVDENRHEVVVLVHVHARRVAYFDIDQLVPRLKAVHYKH